MSRIFSALNLRPEMFGGVGRAMASPHYRKYAMGHIPNVFGWWGNRLGIGWLVWELTGSSGWLGIIVFAGMIPVAILAPVSGVLADRYGHRQVAIVFGVAGGFSTLSIAILAFAGAMTVPLLLGLAILQGVLFGLEFPARQALIPQLCARENVPAALAFNATSFQVGTFLGPVLAGWLIDDYGSGAAIVLFAFSNFWMALMILTMRFRPAPRAQGTNPAGFLADLGTGFRHVLGNPVLRLLFAMSMTSGVLLRPYTELMPGFAADVFGGGPETLGTLTGAAGFGALICAVFLAFRGRTQGLVRIMIAGALGGGTFLALFTAVSDVRAAMPLLALSAMLLLACHVGAYSLIQNVSAPEIRGRVIGVAVSISVGGPALGALALGWIAEAVGLQWAVGASAIAAIAVVLAVMPKLRRAAAEIEATGSA